MSSPPRKISRTSWKRVQGSPGTIRYCLFASTVATVAKEGKLWKADSDLFSIVETFTSQDDAKVAVEKAYDALCEATGALTLVNEGEGVEETPDMLTSLIEDIPDDPDNSDD